MFPNEEEEEAGRCNDDFYGVEEQQDQSVVFRGESQLQRMGKDERVEAKTGGRAFN